MQLGAFFFAGCFNGGSGIERELRYLCAVITMDTSTSYMEAMNMPLGELIAMSDVMIRVSEERRELNEGD